MADVKASEVRVSNPAAALDGTEIFTATQAGTTVGGIISQILTYVGITLAPKASPTFTGTPAAPTAAGGTSTTQVATTAFVAGEVSTHSADTTSVHGITDTSTLYRAGGTDVAVADGGTGVSTANANTVFSGPISGSAAAPAFRALVRDDLPTDVAQNPPAFFEDFIWGFGAVDTTASGTGSAASTNDTGAVDLGGHPGQLVLNTGTTTTGRAGVSHGGNGQAALLLGNGAVTFETDVFLTDALSDGTETYKVWFGFGDSAGAEPTDGVYFRYTHSVNSGKFEAVTRSNSVETAADSVITVAATTWYKLGITVNADATSVVFSINGSVVATNTTNIPTGSGRQTGVLLNIIKSAGTTARRVAIDYIYCRIALTTAR